MSPAQLAVILRVCLLVTSVAMTLPYCALYPALGLICSCTVSPLSALAQTGSMLPRPSVSV